MKILQGEMAETRYIMNDEGKLDVLRHTPLNENDAAYIDDSRGFHKMSNARTDISSVSLHICMEFY